MHSDNASLTSRGTGQTFPGLYLGTVVDNDDSNERHPHLGRVKVKVPQVYGTEIDDDELPWAWPCMVMGGGVLPRVRLTDAGSEEEYSQPHGLIAIPAVDATIVVGFLAGDPSKPFYLGTWYGETGGGSEMPKLALEDSRTGTVYPDIFLLKPYVGRENGMFIRFIDDKRMEFVFEDGETYLEFDDEEEKIILRTKDWAVEVTSENGTVTLQSGTGSAQQSIELDPDREELTIRAKTLNVYAGDIQFNVENDAEWRVGREHINRSTRTSGFEKH